MIFYLQRLYPRDNCTHKYRENKMLVKKIKVYLWNTTLCPQQQQSPKSYFYLQGQSQSHVIWKGVISGVCMPNMKSPSLTVQKL